MCIGQVAMAEGLPLGVTSSKTVVLSVSCMVFEDDKKGYNEPYRLQ